MPVAFRDLSVRSIHETLLANASCCNSWVDALINYTLYQKQIKFSVWVCMHACSEDSEKPLEQLGIIVSPRETG